MSVNKVILLGNVGNDPEIRESNGGKFATFRLATTDRAYTKKDGTMISPRISVRKVIADYGFPLISKENVTHWMPLPQPPKKGGEE